MENLIPRLTIGRAEIWRAPFPQPHRSADSPCIPQWGKGGKRCRHFRHTKARNYTLGQNMKNIMVHNVRLARAVSPIEGEDVDLRDGDGNKHHRHRAIGGKHIRLRTRPPGQVNCRVFIPLNHSAGRRKFKVLSNVPRTRGSAASEVATNTEASVLIGLIGDLGREAPSGPKP